jgi:predicted nucleic acid-binding protein
VRVFLDANVLFTAVHNPEGLSRLLFDLGRHKVMPLISSHLAVDEARANLRLKVPDRAPALDPLVSQLEIVDTPSLAVPVLELPDDDQLILGAALAARATHLLTGDKKHFGPYFEDPNRTGGVRIQTVRAFLSDRFGLKG